MSKDRPRTPEEMVRELQDKLHLSAKREAARAGIHAISHAQGVRRIGTVPIAEGTPCRSRARLRKSGNSESRMRENRTYGLMRGRWKRSHETD